MTMSIYSKATRALGAMALAVAATVTAPGAAKAEPFIGQVTPFALNFCPRGYTEAAGQLLPIAQNTALFSLYGTNFGGDGRTTFGLPDLRGRIPIHNGRGPGLTERRLGQSGGSSTVALTVNQIPSHSHLLFGSNGTADTVTTANTVPATVSDPSGLPINLYSTVAPNTDMAANMIGTTGGGQAHNNMPPFLAVNWCVALVGLYPSRN